MRDWLQADRQPQRCAHSAPATYRQKTRTFHTADEFARMTAGKVRIERALDPARDATLRRAMPSCRTPQFTVDRGGVANSVTWVGTRRAPFV